MVDAEVYLPIPTSSPTEESQHTVFHCQQPSDCGICFPNQLHLYGDVSTSLFYQHLTCSSSRSFPSGSVPIQFTDQRNQRHYQKQCKRCHESFLCELPCPAILLLIYLLEAAEVEVQNTSIDQAESGRKRLGTIILVIQDTGNQHAI